MSAILSKMEIPLGAVAYLRGPAPGTSPATQSSKDFLRRRFDALSPRTAAGAEIEVEEFPTTEQLLTGGGDSRITRGASGVNRYGCGALPDPELIAYGSSTASTISNAGFAAADALRASLKKAAARESRVVTYERELNRMRLELIALCGLEELEGVAIIFGASGTDLHLFASQLMVDTRAPAPLIVRVESTETGRGVPDALAGKHFSDCAALGDLVTANVPLDCGRPIEIFEVKCRTTEGALRPAAAVDAEVEKAVARAAVEGRRVVVTLVDVSKTGVLAPSPQTVLSLKKRFPEVVEVLVDACQFRLAVGTLKACLKNDFIVAITGSKFITGPTFCGALLVPAAAAGRLRQRTLPRALKSYSAQADWPRDWAARRALNRTENYGMLLRWEAALSELRAFRELPEERVADFVANFEKALTLRLRQDPAFEMLLAPRLDRGSIGAAASWDHLPTIFTFLLKRPGPAKGRSTWLNRDETKQVHERLREDSRSCLTVAAKALASLRCQLGQPVECGTRDGLPVSALRLCLSSRLIVDALSQRGRGPGPVIANALRALDKAAALAAISGG